MYRAWKIVFIWALLSWSSVTHAEQEQRLLLINPAAQCGVLDATELVSTVQTYLGGTGVEVTTVEATIPSLPFDRVQAEMIRIAESHEATMVVWCQLGAEEEMLVHVLDVRGDTALVRTLELGEEAPMLFHRTVGAVIRTVVESGMLRQVAQAEDQPPGPVAAEDSTPVVLEEETGEEEPSEPIQPTDDQSYELALGLNYVLRFSQQPDPFDQGIGVRVWFRAIRWLVLSLSGRFAIPSEDELGANSSVWKGGVSLTAGFAMPIRRVTLGALLGGELEWLWGRVELEAEEYRFDTLEVGGIVEVFFIYSIWRELDVIISSVLKFSPTRRIYVYRDVPVASSDHVEGGVEVGFRWSFF